MLQKRYTEMKMTDSTDLSEHERAWENLAVTYMTLERARELELGKVGLTIPQAGVLYFLKTSKEPLTPMKLSRRMNRQPHTVSALLTRMEAQGLVKTTKDLDRKNWVRVSLTKKGEEAFKRQMTERTARNATSCLSKKEIDALNAICKKLRVKGAELIRHMQPGPYSEPLF
jgi:DNA-binding MarR family transcriptional regulator